MVFVVIGDNLTPPRGAISVSGGSMETMMRGTACLFVGYVEITVLDDASNDEHLPLENASSLTRMPNR